MSRKAIIAVLLLGWVAVLAVTLSAQQIVRPDRSGVKPQALSLPSGPGSIEGLGESFKPDLNSGVVSYQVKLALPPAVNGHKPDIALNYNGGSGNGPFGLGWNVPTLYVQRQTDKGLPTYTDQDTFIYFNQEELVPLADGNHFGKNEGEFIRLRRVGMGANLYWEGTARNGTRFVFGRAPAARITTPEGAFQWLLEQSTDANGNRVEYTYLQDQRQAYLSEVRYNLIGTNFNSILFNYEPRPDRFPDYRSRYNVMTALRCASIEIRSRGQLQRRYVLQYLNGTFSLLRSVTLYGRDGQTTIPPVTFNYTGVTSNPALMDMTNSPEVSFTDTVNLELLDADGDGLPDLLMGEKDNYRYIRNQGSCTWDRAATRMANSPPFDFEPLENTLGDYNGKGIAGVVHKGKAYLFYENTGNDRFDKPQSGNNPAYQFSDGSVQMVDLNFDKRPDVLQSILSGGENRFYVWINLGNNRWSDRIEVRRPDPARVLLTNDRRVQLADMNGDRMLDLVWVSSGQIEYYPLRGYYNRLGGPPQSIFDTKVVMQGDGTAPMLVALYQYDMGRTEESLKGKLLRVELLSEDFPLRCLRQPDGSVVPVWPDAIQLFRREIFRYTTRTLERGTTGVEVRYSFNSLKSTFVFEKTDQPREIVEEFDHDNFGNEIRRVEYNDVTDGVIPVQQRVTLTEYASNPSVYIVDKPARRYVTDGDGQFVSETRFYYDGPDYVGLPRGQITRGNLTRKSVRLGPQSTSGDRFIDLERKRYDAYGNVVGVLDALGNAQNPTAGHARAITFDPVFQTFPVEERIYLEGGRSLVLRAEYDVGFGVVTAATDAAGQRTTFEYDALARLAAIVKPGDTPALPTERYTYTLASPVSSIRIEKRARSGQPQTVVSVQYVDGLGRKLQTKQPAGPTRFVIKDAVTFNLRGTVKEKYLPYFTNTLSYEAPDATQPKTQTFYDSLGREMRLVQPVGGFIQTTYLPLRRVVQDEENTNPSSPHFNKPRTLTFDGFNRLVAVEERSGKETYLTLYGYDLLDHLTYVQDGLGNTIVMTYDGAKRLVNRQDPDRGPLVLIYDDAGNAIESRDGNGQIVRNSYDAANRLKMQVFIVKGKMAPHATYHYDSDLPEDHGELTNTMGRLAYVEDQTGRSMFSFDARGNIITEIRDARDIGEYATRFAYDALDRIVSIIYPDGMQAAYTYDARGLLASVPGYAPEIEYTAAGQFARMRFQNGAETLYGYDARQRLTSLRTTSPGATPSLAQDLGFTYDGVSNLLRITDGRPGISDAHNATEDFTYDNLYRLTQTRGRYGEIRFAYDPINNLISKTSTVAHPDLNIGAVTYGEAAGPHQVVRAGDRSYAYDGNGNLLARTGFTYVWDAKNRLVSAIGDDGDQTYLAYDFADRRVIKVNGDNVAIYLNKYAELRNGQLIKYVFAGPRRLAQVNDQGVMYYHADHLGSTNLVTNASGAVVERIQYYAFGTERIREGSFRAGYRYIDRELDESTGLYYLMARYYSDSLGMFLSGDPVDFDKLIPQSINPYDYGLHNPYRVRTKGAVFSLRVTPSLAWLNR